MTELDHEAPKEVEKGKISLKEWEIQKTSWMKMKTAMETLSETTQKL